MKFTHETLGQRVRFGSGLAADGVREEVERLGATRVMVISTPRGADVAARVSEGVPVALTYDDVAMHVPVDLARRAVDAARQNDVDALVSVGGGSSVGLAKAIALETSLPIVAVPTTYAGSEATSVWGLTEDGKKTTGTDLAVLPRSVVYDASLVTSLPVDLSVASGLNALAHCVDSLWAPNADPINAALATEGIRVLASGLPKVVADPRAVQGREETLYGAYIAAVAFASAGSGLHHKICHVLGGKYNLPHAPTHAIVLPYVLALNGPAAPAADARIAAAFGSQTGLKGLQELRRRTDAPRALRDLGFGEDDIPGAVDAILPSVPDSNPADVTPEILAALLRAAWEGAEPQ